MLQRVRSLRRRLCAEDGQSLVEYGLLIGITATGFIYMLTSMGDELARYYEMIAANLRAVAAGISLGS
jgi:Flp pilus assembly pilin Flp